MATQKQRAETTRAQLIRAFRESFLKSGYDATTTQHILDQTGLSKGAMYHHFRGKSEIMQAVYEHEVQNAFDRAIARIAEIRSPVSRVEELYLAWMEEIKSPSVSAILFEIGPKALGPYKARRIDDRLTRQHIEAMLNEAIEIGEIDQCDPRLVVSLLNGLVVEAALHRLHTGNDPTPELQKTLNAALNAFGK